MQRGVVSAVLSAGLGRVSSGTPESSLPSDNHAATGPQLEMAYHASMDMRRARRPRQKRTRAGGLDKGPDALVTDQWHQVVPSPTVLARDLERQLGAIQVTLASLERDLKEQQHGPTPRSDSIAIALDHVQAAIDALELAAQP